MYQLISHFNAVFAPWSLHPSQRGPRPGAAPCSSGSRLHPEPAWKRKRSAAVQLQCLLLQLPPARPEAQLFAVQSGEGTSASWDCTASRLSGRNFTFPPRLSPELSIIFILTHPTFAIRKEKQHSFRYFRRNHETSSFIRFSPLQFCCSLIYVEKRISERN